MAIEYGDRFTFEKDGAPTKTYELLDPADMDEKRAKNFGVRPMADVDHAIRSDDQVLLVNVDTGGIAAIRGHWLLGIRDFPGRWAPA